MACILEFRKSDFRARAGEPANPATAEIVLFPGVRYERAADDTDEAKTRRRARRRDHLDLDD